MRRRSKRLLVGDGDGDGDTRIGFETPLILSFNNTFSMAAMHPYVGFKVESVDLRKILFQHCMSDMTWRP